MKITLDTLDVKQSITEFLISRNVIRKGTPLDWNIIRPQKSDEEIRVDITILEKGINAVFNPDEPEVDETAPTEVEELKPNGLFE